MLDTLVLLFCLSVGSLLVHSSSDFCTSSLAVSAASWLSKWPGSYIRPRGVRVELPVL